MVQGLGFLGFLLQEVGEQSLGCADNAFGFLPQGFDLSMLRVKGHALMSSLKLRGAPRVGIWVVVKIRVPFWLNIIIRHLLFRVPKKRDPNFDNHPFIYRMP